LFNFLLQSGFRDEKGVLMRIVGFLIIFVSMILTVINSFFFSWSPPNVLRGLIDPASAVCVLGCVIGSGFVAYGSELGAAFKTTSTRTESIIAVGVYKLAVRVSIGSGFVGVLQGWIAMLGNMGGTGMDRAALTGGAATSLITILYGVTFAFCLFLPLQYYFQYQLDKDS